MRELTDASSCLRLEAGHECLPMPYDRGSVPQVHSSKSLMNLLSDFLSRRLPFFYGHLMVAVALMAQIGSSPGQTFAVSAFTPYLQESLGLSSSRLAAAYMLGTMLAALPLALVGPISDRFGLRRTLVGVSFGLSVACLVTSAAGGFLSILFGFLLLRCLGQGGLTLLGSNIVSMWFQHRLGRVNAIMSAGGAAAFAFVPLLLIDSIEHIGWRQTYVAMGTLIAIVLVPMFALVLRNRPEDVGQLPDGTDLQSTTNCRQGSAPLKPAREFGLRDAALHQSLWILALGMVLWAMTGTGLVFYALAIFEEQGIEPTRSKLMFVTFSTSMLALQIVGGLLADRLPMHRLLAVGFALLAAGATVVPLTHQIEQVHLFACLFGAGQGLTISVNSTMWVRYYGRRNLGKIRGTVWSLTVAGSGCGPFVLGLFHDAVGSFEPGLWLFAALLWPLAPAGLWATPPAAKGAVEPHANKSTG